MLEPRILIFDGHLSHLWYYTIKLAQEKNVTIIKLPAYTTDVLQPLDVLCFKSLKVYWGKTLFHRVKLRRSKLSKSEFLTIISSKDVWNKSFIKSNIINRFNKCGIVPHDRHAYPRKRFHPNLLNRYETRVTNGREDLTAEELDEMFNVEKSDESNASGNTSINNESLNDSLIGLYNDQKGKFLTYFIADNNPETRVLVSNANVVFSNSTEIITSTASAQEEKN